MVADVAESLHTFFVPQMKQLGLIEQPAKHGSLSTLDSEWGQGILWAHSVSEHCLYTFHDLQLNAPMKLTEFPSDCICVTSMTDSSAKLCPVTSRYLRDRNTVSFHQDGGAVSFTLKPEERHRSYTICMMPEFFDELEGLSDDQKDLLIGHLCSCDTNTHPREVGLALESMNPSWATREGGSFFCEGKVREIIAHMLDAAAKDREEDPWNLSTEDRRIAREAQMIIDERFAEGLTLQSIASELFVGKTRLCAVFRNQIGSCVAEYLRERRMAEARRLLETSDIKAVEVSRAVGYAHPSSFTEAFRREFGMTPSQWREKARMAKLSG